jgi:BolA family transcriptional regulator, general stress-responsive regulator
LNQGVTAERLHDVVRRALAPAQVQVRDDSALHVGHAGAREGATSASA